MEFELIKKDLQNSGSLVAKNKPNSYFQTKIEDEKGGFVYAPSKKRIYNTDELKKTIDNIIKVKISKAHLENYFNYLFLQATDFINKNK